MKRARPDMVHHDATYGPALYWHPSRRCPPRRDYRGEHKPGDRHVEYRRNGDRSRPAPMLRQVKR